jgi:hypothetical protein
LESFERRSKSLADDRQKTIFVQKLPDGQITCRLSKSLVQPLAQKYFASPRRANQGHNSARLTQERGGSRSSRTLRWDAVDADVTKTNVADADGEVVWS